MSELPDGVAPASPPEPRDSAAAIVVRRGDAGTWRVLLGVRSRASRFLPGHLAFPGGALEPADGDRGAEAFARCASRELAEETGLSVSASTWLAAGERVTPPLFPLRFHTRFLLAEDTGTGAPVPLNSENERLEFAAAQQVLDGWHAGTTRVPPPVLPILRALAAAGGAPLPRLALAIVEANALEERTPRIEFQPEVWVLPVPTLTLPPATHTNVWLPGARRFAIVDPGSADPAAVSQLLSVVARRQALGAQPIAVLLTHEHADHTAGAPAVARALGVPLRAHPRALDAVRAAASGIALAPLADGETLDLEGLTLRAIATPGHTAGHLAFHLAERRLLVAGDLVSGLSTIMIDADSGDMGAYCASLARARDLRCTTLLPGHGPPVPAAELERLIEHRVRREQRILELLTDSELELAPLARAAYADAPAAPSAIIERQALAHLLHLERRDLVRRSARVPGAWSRKE